MHYICARCSDPGPLGAAKLNRILFHADVLSYVETQKSITGAVYIKRQFGPVPRDIMAARMRLVAQGAILERQALTYGYDQTQFIALTNPDISLFSAVEISLVDGVIAAIGSNHATSSLSMLSHDLVWELATIGEEIPLSAAAFAGNIGEIDETDMAWAQAEINKVATVRAVS